MTSYHQTLALIWANSEEKIVEKEERVKSGLKTMRNERKGWQKETESRWTTTSRPYKDKQVSTLVG